MTNSVHDRLNIRKSDFCTTLMLMTTDDLSKVVGTAWRMQSSSHPRPHVYTRPYVLFVLILEERKPEEILQARAVRFQKFHIGSSFGFFLCLKNLGSVSVSVLLKQEYSNNLLHKLNHNFNFSKLYHVKCKTNICIFFMKLKFASQNLLHLRLFSSIFMFTLVESLHKVETKKLYANNRNCRSSNV